MPQKFITDTPQIQGWMALKPLIRATAIVTMAFIQMVILVTPVDAQHRLGGPLIDGSVVRARGCGSHFFISYNNAYALAEWLGGEMVRENDVLRTTDDQASFEREGRMTLTNLVTGRTIDLVIEKALMNKAEFSRTVGEVCR